MTITGANTPHKKVHQQETKKEKEPLPSRANDFYAGKIGAQTRWLCDLLSFYMRFLAIFVIIIAISALSPTCSHMYYGIIRQMRAGRVMASDSPHCFISGRS